MAEKAKADGAEMHGKRVMSSNEPSTTLKDKDEELKESAKHDVRAETRKFIESQDKVEVYIPKLRGPQTIQINGENFTVPAGQKVKVPSDIAAFLKRSGALDMPPGA